MKNVGPFSYIERKYSSHGLRIYIGVNWDNTGLDVLYQCTL